MGNVTALLRNYMGAASHISMRHVAMQLCEKSALYH